MTQVAVRVEACMRPSCLLCARKHLAQASILISEAAQGYPEHKWLALGHLAEAGDELIRDFPILAQRMRDERKKLEGAPVGTPFDVLALLQAIGGAEPPALDPVGFSSPWPRFTGRADVVGINISSVDPKTVSIDIPETARAGLASLPWPQPGVTVHATVPWSPPDPSSILSTPPGCGSCADAVALRAYGEAATKDDIGPGKTYVGRLVIMTTLGDFRPAYSLSTVILEQARAAARLGLRVHIWVMKGALDPLVPLPPGVTVERIIPNVAWRDDRIDHAAMKVLEAAVLGHLGVLLAVRTPGEPPIRVITHDILFQSAYTTLAVLIHALHLRLPPANFQWWHMAHSSVTLGQPRDPTNLALTARTSLPPGHRLMAVTNADAPLLARYYDIAPDRIDVVRNARDIRDWMDMPAEARAVIEKCSLLDADVVQIMPLSATRYEAKGVYLLIRLFQRLHETDPDLKLRLVFCTAHANGEDVIRETAHIHAFATEHIGNDPVVSFTHEMLPDTAIHGLPQASIRALWSVANLFAFPTRSEAASLVVLEAALAGQLMVLPEHLASMRDQIPQDLAIWTNWNAPDGNGVHGLPGLAAQILDRLHQDISQRLRRHALRFTSLERYTGDLRDALRL